MFGLQQGNHVLREIQKELNIDRVEQLMDETAEAQQNQRVRIMSLSDQPQEIDETLMTKLSVEEQEAIEDELTVHASSETAQTPNVFMPTVPAEPLVAPMPQASSSASPEMIAETS